MRQLLLRSFLVLLALSASGASLAGDNRHDVVIDGVRLAYWTARPIRPKDVPIVYLHGGPGYNSYSFRRTAGVALDAKYPMVYLDQRGSGASERPWSGDYSMPTLVRDVEGLRRMLGVERMVLMGHSFGGTVAAEYALAHPAHVARLVLLDAAVDIPAAMESWVGTLQQSYPDAYAATLAEPAGAAMQAAAASADACALSRTRMAFVWAAQQKLPDGQAFHDLQQFRQRAALDEQRRLDAESGLRNTGEIGASLFAPDASFPCYRLSRPETLRMPTLLIVGAHDRAVGVGPQRELAARLPHARLVEFADSAHFPYAEQPERFQQALDEFLDGRP